VTNFACGKQLPQPTHATFKACVCLDNRALLSFQAYPLASRSSRSQILQRSEEPSSCLLVQRRRLGCILSASLFLRIAANLIRSSGRLNIESPGNLSLSICTLKIACHWWSDCAVISRRDRAPGATHRIRRRDFLYLVTARGSLRNAQQSNIGCSALSDDVTQHKLTASGCSRRPGDRSTN